MLQKFHGQRDKGSGLSFRCAVMAAIVVADAALEGMTRRPASSLEFSCRTKNQCDNKPKVRHGLAVSPDPGPHLRPAHPQHVYKV